MPLPTKGIALSNLPFYMVSSVDHVSPATGKTPSGQISKDGGVFAACTNSPVEVGLGTYTINLTAAEMNADSILIVLDATTSDRVVISFFTS